MTTRLLSLPLLVATATPLFACTGCPGDNTPIDSGREPYVDEWRVEASGPAAALTSLSIGDRLTSDNFANRGNVEVYYVDGTDQITIEMQRFTIAKTQEDADAAFGRMKFWGYNIATPAAPTPEDAVEAAIANARTLLEQIVGHIGATIRPTLGLDAQLSNWASRDGELVFRMDSTFSISTNPNFRFTFGRGDENSLDVAITDTDETHFAAKASPSGS